LTAPRLSTPLAGLPAVPTTALVKEQGTKLDVVDVDFTAVVVCLIDGTVGCPGRVQRSMGGFHDRSGIWYLRRFDAYCAEHALVVLFSTEHRRRWVTAQLATA
jgi:hypothetical protein